MQVLTPRRAARNHAGPAAVAGFLVGLALLGSGVALAYLAYTSSLVDGLMTTYRPGPTQIFFGVAAWTIAFVAPAAFVLIGLTRVLSLLEPAVTRRGRRSVTSLVGSLSDEYVAATRVRLPDGRIVPEVVVGPHGVAVFAELPPAHISRQSAGRWEVRFSDGRWMPLENPLARTARDAEGIRRWFGTVDHDYVVRVYAAVIAPDTSVPRIPTCAVITREQIPAFLAALPVQRSLTPDRRQRLVELLGTGV